ncbi:hypothetical protein B0A49_07291 [Cryomyces minteri]|uniref:Uncharacterized protein n=2 Tax=Cryomyces minteri TaxID=331657 RepID=A0A4V6WL09_9PEZI|nr:hypothetical protein B0A49_07291 [Cryomyces minteri]
MPANVQMLALHRQHSSPPIEHFSLFTPPRMASGDDDAQDAAFDPDSDSPLSSLSSDDDNRSARIVKNTKTDTDAPPKPARSLPTSAAPTKEPPRRPSPHRATGVPFPQYVDLGPLDPGGYTLNGIYIPPVLHRDHPLYQSRDLAYAAHFDRVTAERMRQTNPLWPFGPRNVDGRVPDPGTADVRSRGEDDDPAKSSVRESRTPPRWDERRSLTESVPEKPELDLQDDKVWRKWLLEKENSRYPDADVVEGIAARDAPGADSDANVAPDGGDIADDASDEGNDADQSGSSSEAASEASSDEEWSSGK